MKYVRVRLGRIPLLGRVLLGRVRKTLLMLEKGQIMITFRLCWQKYFSQSNLC